MATPDHYEVLGVAEGASDEEIRHAYRRLAKAAHPDAAGDPAQFRRVTLAYDVLSDPVQRAAYDQTLRRPAGPVPPRRRRRIGRSIVLVLCVLVGAGFAALAVATARQSVGDDCLVGTWRGEDFDLPFRAVAGGREIAATLRGGAGVALSVHADGRVRVNYATAAPLTGTDGPYRIEGVYDGTSVERWAADDGKIETRSDPSGLCFVTTINGEPLDQPLEAGVLDGEYPYACTSATLQVGPYRYTRGDSS